MGINLRTPEKGNQEIGQSENKAAKTPSPPLFCGPGARWILQWLTQLKMRYIGYFLKRPLFSDKFSHLKAFLSATIQSLAGRS